MIIDGKYKFKWVETWNLGKIFCYIQRSCITEALITELHCLYYECTTWSSGRRRQISSWTNNPVTVISSDYFVKIFIILYLFPNFERLVIDFKAILIIFNSINLVQVTAESFERVFNRGSVWIYPTTFYTEIMCSKQWTIVPCNRRPVCFNRQLDFTNPNYN